MKSNLESVDKHSGRTYIIFVLLCLGILSTAMCLNGIWPFGNKTMLLWDMEIQYINIYNWFYDVLHGNASLFYDFSKSLGGNMYGIYGLYLASPLNLLIFFFPQDKIVYFITISTIIKICLSGVMFLVYLDNRFTQLSRFMKIVLALSFALMEYNVGLCSNLHFMDCIYALPLVALGIYLFINKDKGTLYALSLGYCLFTDWYVGFMVCVFVIFYYFTELAWCGNKRTIINKCILTVRFGVLSIIGVMIGAVTFIPSIMASTNGKGSIDWSLITATMHCTFVEPMKGLLLVSQANTSYEEPAIYCGGIVVIIFIYGLFSRQISLKKKLPGIISLGLIFLSFSFVPLELMWTAFKKTYSFHFRYSFVFSFLLCVVSAMFINEAEEKTMTNKEEKSSKFWKCLPASIVLILSITIFIYATLKKEGILYESRWYLFILLLESIVYVGYRLLNNKSLSYICLFAIMAFLVGELVFNTNYAFTRYKITTDAYCEYFAETDSRIQSIKENDASFYRLEKTFSEMDKRRKVVPVATEGLSFNYNSLTHYSTLYDSKVADFLTDLGYCKRNAMSTNYVGTNPLADSILGVKYIITDQMLPVMIDNGTVSVHNENYYINRNEYALSFATMVKSTDYGNEVTSNVFENQENMLRALLGEHDASVYVAQNYKKEDNRWTVTVDEDGPIYGYFMGSDSEKTILVNEQELQPYFSRFYKNVMYLGSYKQGETFTVTIKDDENCEKDHGLLVYRLDEVAYELYMKTLQQKTIEPYEMSDTGVSLTYKSDVDTKILLSVPYDSGWSVYLNNKKINTTEAFGALISVDVPAGTGTISMSYAPPYLYVSMIVSGVGILLLIMRNSIKKGKRKE